MPLSKLALGRILARKRVNVLIANGITHLGQGKQRNKRKTNTLRMDRTRTGLIRKKFIAEIARRFAALRRHVVEFIDTLDALGLKPRQLITLARPQKRQYEFLTSDKKLAAFNEWFRQAAEEDILAVVGPDGWKAPTGSIASGPWTDKYVESAYKKGLLNGYIAAKKNTDLPTDFADMSQEEFMQQSFNAPERISKVKLLGTRTWENMKGVTSTMGTQMNQILAQGMVDGRGAAAIAKEMAETIDGLTRSRAMLIARTEIIHAHAEGQLDSYEELGIDELNIMAEWSTAGDDRVCPLCAKREGKLYTVQKARGLIPLHPNCRCTWIPTEAPSKKSKSRKRAGR